MSMLPHLTGFLLFSLFVLITLKIIDCASFSNALPKCAVSYGDGVQVIARRVGGCMGYGDIYVCKGLHAY